jgi:hypothetical protein
MTNTILSRRHLLAGASVTASAQLVSSALPAVAKAPLLKTQAPAFDRFNIGGIEATVVSDGVIVGVTKATFVGPAAANVEKMPAGKGRTSERTRHQHRRQPISIQGQRESSP